VVLALVLAGPVLAAPETLCGRVDEVGADTALVDGQSVPLDGLDATAVAGLQLALNGGLEACVDVEVIDGSITQAYGVTVSADLCGNVRPVPFDDVMVDRVHIPLALTDAETYDALRFAMSINGAACLAIDVAPGKGGTLVDVALNMEVCATVTGVGTRTLELDGFVFDLAPGTDLLGAEVGDVICVIVVSAEAGGVEVTQRTDDVDEQPDPDRNGGGDNGGDDSGGPTVPDTAAQSMPPLGPLGALLLLVAALLVLRHPLRASL
jgi:hypothetical protein